MAVRLPVTVSELVPDADSSNNAAVGDPGTSGGPRYQPAYSSEQIQSLRILRVNFREDLLHCVLSDGKLLCVPIGASPALAAAPMHARDQWRISGDGKAIVWYGDELKEHLSLRSLLSGLESEGASLSESDPSR